MCPKLKLISRSGWTFNYGSVDQGDFCEREEGKSVIPLIDRQLYSKLRDRASQMARVLDGGGSVFVPVAPSSLPTGVPRILFVGQARGEMGPSEDFDAALRESTSVVEGRLGGWFWNAVHTIFDQMLRTIGAFPTLETASIKTHEALAWSNLVKIKSPSLRNAPGPEIVGAQADLCVESLSAELRLFRPHATVLLTGNYAQVKILEQVFGPAAEFRNNVESEDRVAVKKHSKFGHVIWANHPGAMGENNKNNKRDVGFIAGYLAGLLVSQAGTN